MIYQFKKISIGIAKRELECNIIRNLLKQKKYIESDSFMLCFQWAQQYTEYLYENICKRPTCIDNSPLFSDAGNGVFRKGLQSGKDFIIVSDIVWIFLKEEYSGGPEAVFENYVSQTERNLSFSKKEEQSSPTQCQLQVSGEQVSRSKSHDSSQRVQ